MIGAAALALASHWRRRRGQLVTLIAGLALATALWSGVQAINAEARAAYARAAGQVGSAALPRITRDGGVTMAGFRPAPARRLAGDAGDRGPTCGLRGTRCGCWASTR